MPIIRRAPFEQIAVVLLLISNAQGVSANSNDVWVSNTCIPIPCYRIAPEPRFNPKATQSSGPRLAQPTAAPPSADKPVSSEEFRPRVPPPPVPAVTESAKPERQHGVAIEEGPSYDLYPILLKEKPFDDQCTVTLQNLAGKPLKVIVNNRDQELADKQTVTIPVPRQFSWRVEGREPRLEQIGKNDFAVQIVIRR